jgi:hypothetical protein
MAKRQKKVKIVQCGSCYNDFEESEVVLATMHINPNKDEHNGRYQKYLCSACIKDPYYQKRVINE